MTRTFKISFPLPGLRPSSSPITTPGSQLSGNNSEHDGFPAYYPSPKAQEVLGAATPDSTRSTKKPSRKERKNLRKYPSFMSVTLADLDENESAKADGFPFPGMQTPSMVSALSQTSRPPFHSMSRHGSSPLLGENPAIGSTTMQSDYFSIDNTSPRPQARHASSFSTLRSYYDKAKSPLSITQQTSDSSARDMALRKGEPQITRSMTMTHVPERTHSRNVSGASKTSDGSKISANTKIAGNPRRRPSVNDHPTLHPNAPKAFAHAVSPPPALINASVPKSMQPGQVAGLSFSKPKWWDRRKPHMSRPVDAPDRIDYVPSEDGMALAKVHVRRPKKGVSNWFDAIDTDESSLNNTSESEAGQHQLHDEANSQIEAPEAPLTIHEIMEQGTPRPAPATSSRKSSFNSKNKRSGLSDRKLSFKLDSSPPGSRPIRESTQMSSPTRASLTRSGPGSPTRRPSRNTSDSRAVPLGDLDLQIQSVLNLSSSEDEEETETETSAPESSSYKRHRIRASIERSDYGNEVLLGSALRVQPVKPKPVVNKQGDRNSFRRSKTSDAVPPVPQLPSRPQLTQRSSSIRWRALLEERAAASPSPSQYQYASTTTADASESTIDSAGESSINGNTPPSSHSLSRLEGNKRSSNTPLRRGSKLMSVTSEEETLLEAMREKRASIRATDFQKGFNSAMQMHVADYLNRPKTSGADGRTSRSSIYGAGSSRGSISPPLLGPTVYRPPGAPLRQQGSGHTGHFYKASLGANSGLSASTDNLTLEDAYPFPEVPSEPIPITTLARSPIAKSEDSPSLTFSSADILPSTPSTKNSPLTPPPPGMQRGSLVHAYEVVRGSSGISPPRGSGANLEVDKGQYGHERRETSSSSVVMLDGVESYAAKLDEENEISGWAVDSGMDRW